MPKKTIIITRPILDAEDTAKLIIDAGFNCFIEPIINIEILPQAKATLIKAAIGADAIIITSKNSVRAISSFKMLEKNALKLITLGKSTSRFALEHGCKNVQYGGEDIVELKKNIKSSYAGKTLVYASGETIAEELTFDNCAAKISRIVIYKSTTTTSLSTDFKGKLKNGDFNAVMFFSKETAKGFCDLLKKENLENYIKNLYCFCLSANIAEQIESYGFKATIYPKNPDIDAIIKLLANFQFP